MIIKYQGPGVVPSPFYIKTIDGIPPIGAILCSSEFLDDIKLQVLSVEWRYRYTFFGAKLEAHVLVKQLPTQEELADEWL